LGAIISAPDFSIFAWAGAPVSRGMAHLGHTYRITSQITYTIGASVLYTQSRSFDLDVAES